MGKTRAECSQNAYTSAFLGHWIQILANSSPKSDIFTHTHKKNPILFFRIFWSVGRGQHNNFFFWPYPKSTHFPIQPKSEASNSYGFQFPTGTNSDSVAFALVAVEAQESRPPSWMDSCVRVSPLMECVVCEVSWRVLVGPLLLTPDAGPGSLPVTSPWPCEWTLVLWSNGARLPFAPSPSDEN